MVMRPLLRYVALYAAVELTAIILLTWAVGLGWTLVALAATFMTGVVLAATQLKAQAGSIGRRRTTPQGAVADGVLVGLGSFLVFLPGPVTTAAGMLMLAPPTRAAMRPVAAAMLGRGAMRAVTALNLDDFLIRGTRGDYIDGEIIDEPVYRPGPPRAAIARYAGS